MPKSFNRFAAFPPGIVDILGTTYEDVCARIQPQPLSDTTRELVARKIIELAQNGMHDPDQLRAEVLLDYNTAPQ